MMLLPILLCYLGGYPIDIGGVVLWLLLPIYPCTVCCDFGVYYGFYWFSTREVFLVIGVCGWGVCCGWYLLRGRIVGYGWIMWE